MKLVLISLSMIFTVSLGLSQKQYRAEEREGLKVGDSVPDFTAIDMDSTSHSLEELLKEGPLVVVFYRGYWCPICNKHLKEFEDHLSKIYEKGARVIAISPEKPERLKLTQEKTKASFTLLFDKDYKISKLFRLNFTPGKTTRKMYDTMLGADLENAHSNNSEQLPIPATFVIDQDKTIVWRHFEPNYRKRSSIEEILKNIPENE